MAGHSSDDRHQCHTDPDDIEAARDWIRTTLSLQGVDDDVQRDLTRAFTEITSSVLPRVESRPSGDKVEIQLAVTDATVQMSIVDTSPPFERGGPGDQDGEGGMGLLLLNIIADKVNISPGPSGGSVTTIVKNRVNEARA